MSRQDVVRIAVGIAIGLGLASLPFLQYGAHTHHHESGRASPDTHAHSQHP